MKKLFFVLFCVFFYFGRAQKIFFKDLSNKEPISNAIVKDKAGNSQVSSIKGIVDISSLNLKDTLCIIHPSYFPLFFLYDGKTDVYYLRAKIIELDEIVFSANRQEEEKQQIPYQIELIDKKQIEFQNQQTTADLLQNSGQVFVQKSQAGGGSPVLRGFEANKVLLVVDGVRMNNAIYRGGHLQDIITMDQNMLERTEIIFGPSSTIYGSDALGGVVHLITKETKFSEDTNNLFVGNAFARYSSANNENTGHLDFNYGLKNIAFLTNITFSNFQDLRSGSLLLNGFDTTWKRNFYQSFQMNNDSAMANPDWQIQKLSAYSQLDAMQKIQFKLGKYITSGINLQYSKSSAINRFDRLTELSGGKFKWAEWKYGPQQRLLTAFNLESSKSYSWSDHFKIIFAFQKIDQDRISRRWANNTRRFQQEDVYVYSLNADLQKKFNDNHDLKYGIEFSYNQINSAAEQINILTQHKSPFATRYPDAGSTMRTLSAYLSHSWEIIEDAFLVSGLRLSNVILNASWKDTLVLKFPFSETKIQNTALSGNLGIVVNTPDNWKISFMGSTGFRSPNVDDLGKINESVTGALIIPNPNLKPEYAYNLELGINKIIQDKFKMELNAFHTILENAMTIKSDKIFGKDSVNFGDALSKVQSLQNADRAYLYGFSYALLIDLNRFLSFKSTLTYTYGRYTDSGNDSVMPLDHIPPVFGQTNLRCKLKGFEGDFYVRYNGWKKIRDYRLDAEDNEIYATPDGMPGWFTLNINLNYAITKNFRLGLACENITDNHYRVFASGISAPGRNFVISLRSKF
jgi:hemoglobin/transferrin/lactoferrin receptor protein